MKHAALALVATLAIPAVAHADKSPSAYADAVHAATTDHYRGWILGKLTTWKVGATCWEKIQKPEGRVVSLGSHLTRALANYASTQRPPNGRYRAADLLAVGTGTAS